LPLTIAFRSFRESFTSTIVHLSNQQKPNSKLAYLHHQFCNRFSFPKVNPKFLALNSDQLVDRQKKNLPMHGLTVKCSERIPLVDKDLELPTLISFPNYPFRQNAIKCSMEHIKKVLTCQNYSKVKRLVLKNLVYSSELTRFLNTKFNGLEYLCIASVNSKSDFEISDDPLSEFTTISELEVTLPPLSYFSFGLSVQLKKCIIHTVRPNSKTGKGRPQMVNIVRSTSLETLIMERDRDDRDSLYTVHSQIPCLKTLISNTNGKYLAQYTGSFEYISKLTTDELEYLELNPDVCWYSNLINIYVSESDKYPFLVKYLDGDLGLDFNMVPKCEKFGVFDKFGKLHIVWKKQL